MKGLFKNYGDNFEKVENARLKVNITRVTYCALISAILEILMLTSIFAANKYFDADKRVCYFYLYLFFFLLSTAMFGICLHCKLKNANADKISSVFKYLIAAYYIISIVHGFLITMLDFYTFKHILAVIVPMVSMSFILINNPKFLISVNSVSAFALLIFLYIRTEDITSFFAYAVNIIILIVFMSIGSILNYYTFCDNEASKLQLEDVSVVDELTMLQNRRGLNKFFVNLLIDEVDEVDLLAIAMIDIDFFKQYNDIYGHIKGDMALSSIGIILQKIADEFSVDVFRYGGEEFLLFAKNKTIDETNEIIDRFNYLLKEENIIFEKGLEGCITCSIGVCYISNGIAPDKILSYIEMADSALYYAKETGRNKSVFRYFPEKGND